MDSCLVGYRPPGGIPPAGRSRPAPGEHSGRDSVLTHVPDGCTGGYRDPRRHGRLPDAFVVEGPLAGMFCRGIVVIDENNTVVHTQQLKDIATEPDYEAAFRALGITVDED